MLYYIGRFLCWLFAKVFGRVTVIGRDNVPATGGVLLAPNHTSYIDPPLVGTSLRRPVWFMAKAELFAVPVLGPIIRRVHAFPVKRGAADRAAMRQAHELLVGGAALTVFFEGGRSRDGRLSEPSLGAAMIALRAHVPIVPVAVIDADKLMPREGGVKFTHVTVIFGQPLTFPHLDGKHADREALREVSETVAREVAALMCQHGASDRVPQGYLERV